MRRESEGSATTAPPVQPPANTCEGDQRDGGLGNATLSAVAVAPEEPRREVDQHPGTTLPHGPRDGTSTSEADTAVTSCVTPALGQGTGVAPAEVVTSTALVPASPATAPTHTRASPPQPGMIAPPLSAQTDSGYQGQPNGRPPTRSTPSQQERSERRPRREEQGPPPSQEPRFVARPRETNPTSLPASRDNAPSSATEECEHRVERVGGECHDRARQGPADEVETEPRTEYRRSGGGPSDHDTPPPPTRPDSTAETSEPLVCGICLLDVSEPSVSLLRPCDVYGLLRESMCTRSERRSPLSHVPGGVGHLGNKQ